MSREVEVRETKFSPVSSCHIRWKWTAPSLITMWHAGHQHSKEEVERCKSELQKRRIKNLNEKKFSYQLQVRIEKLQAELKAKYNDIKHVG